MNDSPQTVYGQLIESTHISGYGFQRAKTELEWLLENDRWQQLDFEDGDAFVESVEALFAPFKIDKKERIPLSKKLTRIASQTSTAKALGVDESTVREDLGKRNSGNPETDQQKPQRPSETEVTNSGNPETDEPWTSRADVDPAKSAKKQANTRSRQDMQKADEERVKSLKPTEGKFRTLIIDPPWDYEWLSLAGRAKPGYATMTHDELLAFDVPQWAEDECHLYLWTTNNFMTRAVELMSVWGFDHKTVLTWVKPRWGLGSYFRNSTEHVLFGTRGDLRTRSDSIATHFEAPVTEHSAKPDAFYDIVKSASHLPAGEIFQRTEREGFENVFEDRDA